MEQNDGAPLLFHPLHFDFLFLKHSSGLFLAEERGGGNEVPLGVLGHCGGVKGLCTQAVLGLRAAKGCAGHGFHHSCCPLSTLSPGHPQAHPSRPAPAIPSMTTQIQPSCGL